MTKIFKVLFFGLLVSLTVNGQSVNGIFTQDQLFWYIKNYHPISVQGKLLIKEGESKIRKAKGAFDPYLFSNLNQKNFDSKQYFNLLGGGLKIPTWYGIDLKTGYDQTSGVYINPENNLPSAGLWYAGISVPIGQGLVINKRRAILKQAKLFAESTMAEQKKIMNDLFFSASEQYWKWVEAWSQFQIYEESVKLALDRFNAVKQSYLFGDKPAIDTLEAFIQVQNRKLLKNQAELSYQNLTLDLSNYLWFENNTPLILTDSIKPPKIKKVDLPDNKNSNRLLQLLNQLEDNHPELILYQYKLSAQEVENKLKKEMLKPKLNFNYNALSEPVNSEFVNSLSTQNYKWGMDLSFPIFLRKQRGDLQLAQLKIQDTRLSQKLKLQELQNKVRNYYNKQNNLETQINLFSDAVNNYGLLAKGEQQKFESGESSLFLVNSRENKLIEARLKLTELITKFYISNSGLLWAAGALYN